MTVPASAPDEIVSAADILAATDGWTNAGSTAADIYWPEFDGDTTFSTNPLAILEIEDARTMMLMLYADEAQYGENELRKLGTELRFQLPTRYRADGTGTFINVDPLTSEVGESNLGQTAFKGQSIITITMTLAIGVDQDA